MKMDVIIILWPSGSPDLDDKKIGNYDDLMKVQNYTVLTNS
jgi:hypothetical protein